MKEYVKVVSMGGVASTKLARHIMGDNEESQTLKHCIHPKFLITDEDTHYKFIYLIGNPYNSICSIFKHNLQHIHEVSMTYGKVWFEGPRGKIKNQYVFDGMGLEEYLKNNNVDRFYTEEHIDNWLNYDDGHTQIRIVKYEYLENHINEILDFANCKKPFSIKKRKNYLKDQPEYIQKRMKEVYGPLKEKIDSLPSIIRKN